MIAVYFYKTIETMNFVKFPLKVIEVNRCFEKNRYCFTWNLAKIVKKIAWIMYFVSLSIGVYDSLLWKITCCWISKNSIKCTLSLEHYLGNVQKLTTVLLSGISNSKLPPIEMKRNILNDNNLIIIVTNVSEKMTFINYQLTSSNNVYLKKWVNFRCDNIRSIFHSFLLDRRPTFSRLWIGNSENFGTLVGSC